MTDEQIAWDDLDDEFKLDELERSSQESLKLAAKAAERQRARFIEQVKANKRFTKKLERYGKTPEQYAGDLAQQLGVLDEGFDAGESLVLDRMYGPQERQAKRTKKLESLKAGPRKGTNDEVVDMIRALLPADDPIFR